MIEIGEIKKIALEAGAKIMEIYEGENFEKSIEVKADNSPVTIADKEANKIIVKMLAELDPTIPIISEEEKSLPYANRKGWSKFWLVDPLDGTKEFIKRNGEFTVNIALVENGEPTIGVIYAPVLEVVYEGEKGDGAYKTEDGVRRKIQVNKKTANLIAVGSRSHASEEDEQFLKSFDIVEKTSKGSSLKFCLVAEGAADIYFRSGPTMEWDTAAGHAVLIAAGGVMTKPDGSMFDYNKESLLNGGFVCKGF